MEIVAPELIVEGSLQDVAIMLAISCVADGVEVRNTWPMPSNDVRDMLVDIQVLGLTSPSKRKHPAADRNEYWTLTESGRELLTIIRREALERRAGAVPKAAPPAERAKP